jgi:copper chaperone
MDRVLRSYHFDADKLSPGVKEFDVSLDSQTATIKTDESVDYTTVLEKIKKTGKAVNSGEADGVAQAV